MGLLTQPNLGVVLAANYLTYAINVKQIESQMVKCLQSHFSGIWMRIEVNFSASKNKSKDAKSGALYAFKLIQEALVEAHVNGRNSLFLLCCLPFLPWGLSLKCCSVL